MKTERYLQIPKPCHENWDTMTAADKGRFCSSCSKEVIDFSLLTDAEVLNFFKKDHGNTCGRFTSDQLQRPLQETQIEKKKGWKWMLASITSLIMISRLQAQDKKNCSMLVGKVAIEKPKDPVVTKGEIKLRVDTVSVPTQQQPFLKNMPAAGNIQPAKKLIENKNDQPIMTMGATVVKIIPFRPLAETVPAAPIREKALTDQQKGLVSVTFESPKIPAVVDTPVNCTELMGDVVVILPLKVSRTDTIVSLVRKIVSSSVKIYPSPARKNSIIHISAKEAGSYQVQLFDNTSRLLRAAIVTVVKEEPVDFELPGNMANGLYYIRLINQQTKKTYTEKLVVE